MNDEGLKRKHARCRSVRLSVLALFALMWMGVASAGELLAGAAKVDITNTEAGLVNDPLFVKALVLKNDDTTMAIITLDVVAIGGIGAIGDEYLANVRARVEKELKIPSTNVLVNASHCHGVVCADVEARTFQAVAAAAQGLVPVLVGAGRGREERVSENRRFKLKSGREVDSRRAYSLPPDEEIIGVGPIDPEIGVLRLDRLDGTTLAAVYNFACHPIEGTPSGGNTADLTGFASQVIEDNLGGGAVALFLQGCAGDLNPARYKDVDAPPDAEPLGNLLGLSTLKALRQTTCAADTRLKFISETIELPRSDTRVQIAAMEQEREALVGSLKGTSINLKTFVPLLVKYKLSPEYPSHYGHRYLHEEAQGRGDLKNLDVANRVQLDQYIANIHTMEALTRLQENLRLLKMHQADNEGKKTVSVELLGLRIGEFVLVTFPGELTVQNGLDIKRTSPHGHTFVAGYTNGYIYYAPTAEQLCNVGGAQEDSDCILAPEWQGLFQGKAAELLGRL